MKHKSRKIKLIHKWGGLILSFFFLMFALSGIFLNHRKSISSIDIPRSILPKDFQFKNWNLGAVKGGINLSPDSIFLYGTNGVLLTDSMQSKLAPLNNGLEKGVDNQIIGNIVKTSTGDFFAISTYSLYHFDRQKMCWIDISELLENTERLTDLAVQEDSLFVMSRSNIFTAKTPYSNFNKLEFSAPKGYKKEVSWFRTMWTLHSGELFGTPGKLVVDFVGVITSLLCITGLIILFFPSIIRRYKEQGSNKKKKTWFRKSLKWHNKLGATFIFLFLFVISTGMFLRPPLLIAIIRGKSKPMIGTTLDSTNPWHDKLRTIRYDNSDNSWILYSSDGFYKLDSITSIPKKIEKAPPVSVMGLTILHHTDNNNWIVGSFSGLYIWNKLTGKSIDFFTKELHIPKQGMPTFDNAIAGYVDLFGDKPNIFHYNNGVIANENLFAEMPSYFKEARMSLWHLCLEVHTGRIYTPLPEIAILLFTFFMGVFSLLVFITGYIIYRRHHKRKRV